MTVRDFLKLLGMGFLLAPVVRAQQDQGINSITFSAPPKSDCEEVTGTIGSMPPERYRVTLYSGGAIVKQWDTDATGVDADGAALFFNDPTGKKMRICGTWSSEELP